MTERQIELDSIDTALVVFGSCDENIRLLEREFGITAVCRGSENKLCGEEEGVAGAARAIDAMLTLVDNRTPLEEQTVRYCISLARSGEDAKVFELTGDFVAVTAKGRPVRPKTLGQKEYLKAIEKNAITFGVGPAGTGKTYLAVAMAVKAFKAHDVSRIILGYAPFGKAIVNSVAFSLQYLKRVVWQLYQHPEEVLSWEGMDLPGDEAQQIAQVKQLLEDYWIILEYNNVKLESNRVLQGLEDPINTELLEEGIPPLRARKMTGDDTFQEVRATLSAIENAKSVIQELDFNMIAATSMISHGVDADRFNLMLFYGMPSNTAEYIQAYSRVGRKHTGLVIDIMRPSREKDQSYLRNFNKFHEFKDILVDPVSINRWAAKAVESTLPGIVSGLLLNYYLYQLKYTPSMGNIGRVEELKAALLSGTITAEALKDHARQIYKCSDDDTSIGSLYRRTVDRMIDELVQKLTAGDFKPNTYLTQAFEECQFHVMRSLRDTDRQVTVELR